MARLGRRQPNRPVWLSASPAPGPSLTIRGESSAWSNTAQITLTTPASTVVGDLIVLVQADDFYTLAGLLTPTGTAASTWTERTTGRFDGGTNGAHAKIWTAPVTTAGAQTVNVNFTNLDQERYGQIFVIAGAEFDMADPAAQVSSTTWTADAATAADTYGLLIIGAGTDASGTTNFAFPGGMTPGTEQDTGFATYRSAYEALSTSGTTGTRAITLSTARPGWTVSVAIKPVAVGGGTVDATDSAGLTDSVALIEQSKVITDDTGLTDASQLIHSRTVTDSAGLTDTSVLEFVQTVTATDSAGLTDARVLDLSKTQTDSAGLTDTAALTQSKTVTDSAGLTDTSTRELSKAIDQTDSAGLTDSTAWSLSKVITDSTGLTDSVPAQQSRVVTDSTGLTDTAILESGKVLAQTDSAGLTDTQAVSQARIVTDSTGLTDTPGIAVAKVTTDSAGLTDAASAGLLRELVQTDSAGLTDAWAFSRSLVLTDSAGLTDAPTLGVSYTPTVTDSAGLTDTTDVDLQVPVFWGRGTSRVLVAARGTSEVLAGSRGSSTVGTAARGLAEVT